MNHIIDILPPSNPNSREQEKYFSSRDDARGDGDSQRSSSDIVEDEGLLSSSAVRQTRSRVLDRYSAILYSRFTIPALAIVLLLCATLVSIFYFLPHTASRKSTSSSSSNLIAFRKPCGDSAAEARARGCRFDVISFLWLPDQCFDEDLINEFIGLHQWDFYLDKNKTIPISIDDASSGEYQLLYVSHEYHMRHCTLQWRKMHRALISPLGLAAVDGYLAAYGHTIDCERVLIDWKDRPFELINTGLVRQFPSCGLYAI